MFLVYGPKKNQENTCFLRFLCWKLCKTLGFCAFCASASLACLLAGWLGRPGLALNLPGESGGGAGGIKKCGRFDGFLKSFG